MAQVQVYNQEGKKALETEGYRESSSGFNKKSTVDTRRYRSWPKAKKIYS